MIIDQPSHTFAQRLATEIDKQPNGLLQQTQIGEQLLSMHRGKTIDRLDLDDQPVIDKQIDPKSRLKFQPIKFDIDR